MSVRFLPAPANSGRWRFSHPARTARAIPLSRAACPDCDWRRPASCRARASSQNQFLRHHEFGHALARQLQQLREFFVAERRALRRSLNLDKTARSRQHEIGVGLGGGILVIIPVSYTHLTLPTIYSV